jgi:hypothetical protein
MPTASAAGDSPVTTMKHLPQESLAGVTVFFPAMARSTRTSSLFRGGAAALAALLLSAAALAAPRPAEWSSCCKSVSAPMGCCTDEGAPAESSASCCRLSATEEAAPSLTSPAAPVLAPPAETSLDVLFPAFVPTLTRALAICVAPRARSAPLHLLYSVFLV